MLFLANDDDIDNNNNLRGPELGCVACGKDVMPRYGFGKPYTYVLYCPNCLDEMLTEVQR